MDDDVSHAGSLIREDKHVRLTDLAQGLTDLAQELDILQGSVHSIVHSHLDEKKVCAPSVPQNPCDVYMSKAA
jgi:hypothetical protein